MPHNILDGHRRSNIMRRRARASNLIIVGATNAYRLTLATGLWETIVHGISGGPTTTDELTSLTFKDGDLIFPSNDDLGLSSDEGLTWSAVAAPPPSGNIFMLDRDAAGNFWTFNNDDSEIYSSADEGQNWTAKTGLLPVATAWMIATHPSDPLRICLSYEDGGSGDSVIEITTDGGASWTQRVVRAFSVSAWRNYTVWLPSGRLVSILNDNTADDLYNTYSDDDGVSWSAPTLLINGVTPTNLVLADLRVTEDGYVLGLVNRGSLSVNGLRSSDGATFSLMTLTDADRAHALAFDEATGNLYITHETDQLYRIANGLTADWSGGVEVSGVPTDAVPLGNLVSNMVIMGTASSNRRITNRVGPF